MNMSIFNFVLPKKVIIIEDKDSKCLFEYSPLQPGFGITIGNSLRRVLLSSLEGFAITSIKLEGITHEFSSVPGIREEVTEIVLNFKQIRFKKRRNYHQNKETVHVTIKKEKKNYPVSAGSLEKFIVGFQVLNTDLILFHKDPSYEIKITFTIEKGIGYVTAAYNKKEEAPIGTIFIDSIYTPILNVKYHVETSSLEKQTEYEKLYMEIKTDGSLTPKEALKAAAKILMKSFIFFIDERFIIEKKKKTETKDNNKNEKVFLIKKILLTNISDLGLSVRAKNCLKSAKIKNLWQLVIKSEMDLKNLRNFGIKTLYEIKKFLKLRNLFLEMDISKYGINMDE